MLRSLRSFTTRFAHAAAIALTLAACCDASARVIPRHTAEMAGLERAWFTQAPLDPMTQTVAGAKLSGGSLYVLTSAGMLQAYDAETGATRWSMRLGDGANTVVLGPAVMHDAVNDEAGVSTPRTLVAATVGSTLFVLREVERGVETIMTQQVKGSPGAAPAFADGVVYVPIVSGRMTGYPLDQVQGVPFVIASPGELAGTPVSTADSLIWATVDGQVYGAPLKGSNASYRFDASQPLSGPPVIAGDQMHFSTIEGVVYGLTAQRAREQWRANVGDEVRKPVVAVDGVLYVATEAPALWALDAATGKQLWTVEGLSQFVSASDKQVFAVAPDGAVGVLDRATGRPVASWPAVGKLAPIANTVNDRLYFVSDDGLVQAFHSEGLAKPYVHNAKPAAEKDEAAAAAPSDGPTAEPAAEEAEADLDEAPMEEEPADEVDPFAPEADDASDEAPADDAAEEDDPFSDF